MTTQEFIDNYDPCEPAREWLAANNITDMADAWDRLDNLDWAVWALRAIEYDDKVKWRKWACWCARNTPLGDGRTTWDLLTDPRSRNAIEVAERYADGLATDEELKAARISAEDGADGAWAARAAAQAAARSAARGAAAWEAARAAARAAAEGAAQLAARSAAGAAQLAALKQIVGNPWRQENSRQSLDCSNLDLRSTRNRIPTPGGAMSNETVRAYVGKRIREVRSAYGETGISQETLAAELNVATNTISRWETGTYEPTLDDLERLSRFFGISIVQFFPQVEGQDPKSKKVDALLRAAQSLQQDDLDELQRYAEFRRARTLQKGAKQRKVVSNRDGGTINE